MNAETYLAQVKKLDRKIKNTLQDIAYYRAMAEYTGLSQDNTKVQTSKGKDHIGDTIAIYVDMETELAEIIKKAYKRKNDIIATIERLPYNEYVVTYSFYVQGKTLQEIASDEDRGYTWVATTKKKALNSLQRVLDVKPDC